MPPFGPPLWKTYGRRMRSHIPAYRTFGFDGSMATSVNPVTGTAECAPDGTYHFTWTITNTVGVSVRVGSMGGISPYQFYICCFRARITGGEATPSVETPEVVLADPASLPENMSLLQRTMLADSLKRDAPAVYQ